MFPHIRAIEQSYSLFRIRLLFRVSWRSVLLWIVCHLPLCITFWKICESFSFFSVYLQKLLCSLFERFEIDRRKLLFYTYFLIPTFNLYCEYIYENESIKNFIYVLLKNCVIDYPLKYTIFCLQFKWLINFVIVRVNIKESIPKQK